MNQKFTILILVIAALLLTGCTSASFSGNYILKSGTTLRGNLFVTSGSVTLEENSHMTGTVLLTSGELHIGKNAQVGGDVVLTSGALYLAEGSVVHGDVILANSEIGVHLSPGATVEGNTTYNIAPFVIGLVIKSVLLYCILPIVILIAIMIGLGTWLGRQSKKRVEVVKAPATPAGEDAQAKLQSLKKLLDEGLIAQTDYEAKKAEILSKM
jgi:uncharacterized membrane protein